jgi:hypothetical protein
MIVELDLYHNEKLNKKMEELFCNSCTRTEPGCCADCTMKVSIEIEEVPTELENGCPHLENDGHCFYCYEKGGPAYLTPARLCKGCEERESNKEGEH